MHRYTEHRLRAALDTRLIKTTGGKSLSPKEPRRRLNLWWDAWDAWVTPHTHRPMVPVRCEADKEKGLPEIPAQ